MSRTSHSLLDPEGLGPTAGFSHGVVAADGRIVFVAGQVGSDATGAIVAGGLVAQFDVALGRIVRVLAVAGGRPEDVVSMTLHTTAMAQYRDQRTEIGAVYRRHFGRHYPAMTLVAVVELVDPAALIEVTTAAVVPHVRWASPETA